MEVFLFMVDTISIDLNLHIIYSICPVVIYSNVPGPLEYINATIYMK